MRDLATRLQHLSPAQKRVLLQRLSSARAPKTRTAPLSYAQQRLWFLDQMVGGNPFYNESSAIRMRYPVDAESLQASVNAVIARHEALRTVFESTEADPIQRVLPEVRVVLERRDLSGLAQGGREAEALRLAQEHALRPFDLSQAPLLRTALYQLGHSDYCLVLTMHHIVCDGWSMQVFFRELVAFYESFVLRKEIHLPEVSMQYADFASWQRTWLTGEVLRRQLQYWKDQLAGLAHLDLPGDSMRPAVPTFRGGRVGLSIPADVASTLRSIADEEGATSFMALLAVYALLLQRYSGQADICIGSPVANRNRPELEHLIGFFVNTLVLRADLSGDPTFRQLLHRVREVALSAYGQQDIPFERVVEELQPKRDPSRNPLFQVTFQLLNAPLSAASGSTGLLQSFDVVLNTAKFDLRCDLWEDGARWSGQLEYSADLFSPQTAARIARNFEFIATLAASSPDQRWSTVADLPEDERNLVIHGLNQTDQDFGNLAPVHERFQAWAAKHPDHTAVADGERSLTYGELNCLADGLAHELRLQGVLAGSLVAILAERSLDLVLAQVAILKAGAAFLPIDPASPAERVASMLHDSGVRIALTQLRHRTLLPGWIHAITVENCVEQSSVASTPSRPERGKLAYVIFTSGSAGRPRGVEISHESLGNLVDWHHDEYKVTEADRASLCANPSFDASVWEIWPYLTAGASLHVPPLPIALDMSELAAWMANEGITIGFLPTPLAEQFIEGDWPDELALRVLLTGGDKLHAYPRRELPFVFYNNYGPTENTVVATACKVPHQDNGGVPPIGHPIRNVKAYLLDRNLRPVPMGARGDLYLGGKQVARGYLGDRKLTDERFIADPFDRRRDAMLYRTGDIVRWRADGELEFLGRADRQIKVRGFRIEPGEVESILEQHAAVDRAVVVTNGPGAAESKLTVLIQPKRDGGDRHSSSNSTQVSDWQQMYNVVYGSAKDGGAFNIVGWNSSYTGLPLTAEEMREQVDGTVDRLRALGGRRILEIGCGTGLLLLRLANGLEQYVATDFSAPGIEALQQEVGKLELSNVTLLQREADDFSAWEPGTFDVIILNSVIQYFPDVAYLRRVLDGALQSLRPGGKLFVGDVRSFRHLMLFSAGVELARCSASTTTDELNSRVDRRIAAEPELLVSSDFFSAWAQERTETRVLWSEARRGSYHNELTRYRYDVLIEKERSSEVVSAVEDISWIELGSIEALRYFLDGREPKEFVVRGVPSARLAADQALVEWLQTSPQDTHVSEFQPPDRLTCAVEPEDLWALGRTSDYVIRVTWAESNDGAYYDVWCLPKDSAHRALPLVGSMQSLSQYTNVIAPANANINRERDIRAFAKSRLPEYMIPSEFIFVESIPLTPNGKLDRRALPKQCMPARDEGAYIDPANTVERTVADIWRDLLGLDRISVHANFFDLGGHSLLLVRMRARLKQAFSSSLSIIDLFLYPTVATLAAAISSEMNMCSAGSSAAARGD